MDSKKQNEKFLRRAAFVIGPLLAVGLVLFPFDWLGEVWPGYARIFDVVFATPLSHIIGHAALFMLTGLVLLLALPVLRVRPRLFLAVMVLGAVAEEAIQSLAKGALPTWWDARDLLMDSIGTVVALLLVRAGQWMARRNAA